MSNRTRFDKTLSIICAILFATFSFIYIYTFQGELLALMQDHLSKGVTTSNSFWAAIIITFLLCLMQYGINRISKLHGRWEAVSYIPSCVLLALVTNVNDGTMLYSASECIWGIPLTTLLFIGLVWINRMHREVKRSSFASYLWPNLLSFSLFFVLTAQISNHAPAPHMELAAWKYLHDDRYEDLLKVGKHSDDYNRELTALRNLAMFKTGSLAERMFQYPQPFEDNGILFNDNNKGSISYGAKEYYTRLGAEPHEGESGRAFAQRLAIESDSIGTDYSELYLATLLLDKDLDTFVAETDSIAKSTTTLPTHYQEAWMLYNELHPESAVSFAADSAIVKRFADYRELQKEHADNAIVASNLAKRKFGNTYWCYFDY